MPLFRFAWLTSCLSIVFAYSQSLLRWPDAAPTVRYPFEVSFASASATPLTSSAVSGLQSSLTGALEQGLTQSTRDWHRNRLTASHSNGFEASVCRLSIAPQNPIHSSSSQPLELNIAHRSMPQRLGQMMKNLFNRKDRGWGKGPSAEVVVKPARGRIPSQTWERLRNDSQLLERISDEDAEGSSSELASGFQVWVNGRAIANFEEQHQADLIAERLREVLSDPDFEASAIKPTLIGEQPAAMMGNRLLFVVNEAIAPKNNTNRELLVIKWIDRLRAAMGAPPLKLVAAQRKMYDLVETSKTLEGLASWYGDYFHGRLTANGEIYNQHAFTAAHPSLPFNTYLKVTNLDNDNSVIVRINDRGPFIAPRTLDLSLGVAQCIGSDKSGVVPYRATIMKPDSPLDNI